MADYIVQHQDLQPEPYLTMVRGMYMRMGFGPLPDPTEDNTADLSINRDFFIEAVNHQISANRLHQVTYLLSDAVQFSDFWVLNTSALGTSTRLAY